MALDPGTRLAAYEVIDLLGVGGMGEVYRARDTKLGRSVAVKVLLQAVAFDPERVARFEREARVLASLNHPHIAALFGMETQSASSGSGPLHFLVMELVEGETLAERLQRGALPVEETLRIALQIAEALESAHEKGIVHRDLKPANVKIGADDRVKVLDFGLAKALETDAAPTNLTHSPTLSIMGTQAGMILGTAAYMSPEQAKGLPADQRSDVFSFGVVLYEMLARRQLFEGETAPEILASVLVREPDLSGLPSTLPPRLIDLVKRCLEKQPRKRWQAIGDVRVELETIAANPHITPVPGIIPVQSRRPFWQRAIPIVVTAVIVAAVTAGVMWTTRAQTPAQVARFTIPLPENQSFLNFGRRYLTISPDGTRIAYVANSQLYLRSLSELDAKPITAFDAQTITNPVFSPDGQSIAYWSLSDSTIRRISVAGGAPVTLCEARDNPYGMSWSGNSIYFGGSDGIKRVPATGGKVETVAALKTGETGFSDPQVLPDGNWLLFTATSGRDINRFDRGLIVAESLQSHERKTLIEGGSDGQYLPTSHLLYAVSGVLFAVPIDLARMTVSGGRTPIVQGVRRSGPSAQAAFSANGSLAYVAGPASAIGGQLTIGFFDRNGGSELLKIPPGLYLLPRLSPDGKQIAFATDDGKSATIWIYELSRGAAPRRLTFEADGNNRNPVWSPDSQRVTFQSDRDKDLGIFWQRADGTGAAERLTKAGEGVAHIPEAWSPDGKHLLYNAANKDGSTALWIYTPSEQRTGRLGDVESPTSTLTGATFAPDGKWIAYASRQGRLSSAVYVQPFPPTGTKYQISKNEDDAHHPLWSADGGELFFTPGAGTRILAVRVNTRPSFTFGEAVSINRLFTNNAPQVERPFDRGPDGQHFLGLVEPPQAQSDTPRGQQIQVVLNWFEELKARLPAK